MLGLLGEKLGMTHVYDQDGNVQSVTVVKAGPCTVVRVKTADGRDGYDAIQLGVGAPKPKRVSKPRRGHFEKLGVGLSTRLREFRTEKAGEFQVGQKLTVEAFKPGDTVDVQGVTKGRGFQGAMKRHGKRGGPASHGSKTHRRPGSIGQCAWPGRVLKNMKLPGHMGVEQVTTKNLKIVEVRPDENLLFISGAVPGWRGGAVTVFNRAPDFDARDELKAAPKAEAETAEEAPKEEAAPAEEQGEKVENTEAQKAEEPAKE